MNINSFLNIQNRYKQDYNNNNSLISFLKETPKKKLEKLRRNFKDNYKDYAIFDKSFIQCDEVNIFIPHDGRIYFINHKHKDLFYAKLKETTKGNSLYTRCSGTYRSSDNCLLFTWVNADIKETRTVVNIYHQSLIESMPPKFIAFPCLNDDFSKWPENEKIKFYIFLKNAGGKEAVKSFNDSVIKEADKKEKGFIKWACAKLDIASDKINAVNLPEKLFTKLDEIIIPKITNMPHDNNYDIRYTLLCEYAYFITARNLINPLSWLAGFASLHKLPQLWDKAVSLAWKMEGSPEELSLLLGQIIGTVLSLPLGIKLAKTMTPKAMAALKKTIQKAKLPRKTAAAIEAIAEKKEPGPPTKIKPKKAFSRAEVLYKNGKDAFDEFTAYNSKLKKRKIDADENWGDLFFKAEKYLELADKAGASPKISFGANWRLCILKIYIGEWEPAIMHFKKIVFNYIKTKYRNTKYAPRPSAQELGAMELKIRTVYKTMREKLKKSKQNLANEIENINIRIVAIEKRLNKILNKIDELSENKRNIENLKYYMERDITFSDPLIQAQILELAELPALQTRFRSLINEFLKLKDSFKAKNTALRKLIRHEQRMGGSIRRFLMKSGIKP
ncbi:MAG: hypothetical protein ABIH00_10695 [Armatimonadota bacterium]